MNEANPKGEATGYVYMYAAALYCEACGEAIRARLGAEGAAPANAEDEGSYDSDNYPKGPYAVGEADCPHYCDACGVFLENDLTAEGVASTTRMVHEAWQTWRLDSTAITEWARFYDIDPPAFVGVEKPMSYERRINLANPPQDGDDGQCFVFAFGAYGHTYVAAWGRGLEAALEEAAGWLADNAPGHLSDLADEYKEALEEAHKAGLTGEAAEEKARENAETDMTYTESGWLCSWEWMIVLENPEQKEMREFLA